MNGKTVGIAGLAIPWWGWEGCGCAGTEVKKWACGTIQLYWTSGERWWIHTHHMVMQLKAHMIAVEICHGVVGWSNINSCLSRSFPSPLLPYWSSWDTPHLRTCHWLNTPSPAHTHTHRYVTGSNYKYMLHMYQVSVYLDCHIEYDQQLSSANSSYALTFCSLSDPTYVLQYHWTSSQSGNLWSC